MNNSPPTHQFELNCFLTQPGHNLSKIHFKELKLEQKPGLTYGELRDLLHGVGAIWYGMGDSIYLIGDEREFRERLAGSTVKATTAKLIPYHQMRTQREDVLRSLIYGAIDRLMYQRNFLPSISGRQHSYYPFFDVNDKGVTATHSLERPDCKVVAKHGLIFDLDLSPEGPALLWADTKLFTFVHYKSESVEDDEPVYILCKTALSCMSVEHPVLLSGAFVTTNPDVPPQIPVCASSGTTTVVRSKIQRRPYSLPQKCLYTTVDIETLKDLNIYDWWRPKAILSSGERYRITWHLLRQLTDGADTFVIPMPDNQQVIFSTSPLNIRVQIKFT